MRKTLDRLADRMLDLFVPHGEASAGFCDPPICGCFYRKCYCSGSLLYQKLCDGGCNGIPVWCSTTCRHLGSYCA